MEDVALQTLLLHRAKSCRHLCWCKFDSVLLNCVEVLGLARGECERNLALSEGSASRGSVVSRLSKAQLVQELCKAEK